MARFPDQTHSRYLTVAVIEDDASLNQAVSRFLRTAGFRIRRFASGGAVLAQQGTHIADCLVLDVHLSDMSGFELQQKLADAGSTAPVVVITAHDNPAHRRAAEEIGAVAYLTKPFSCDSLLEAVSRAMATATP